MCALPNGWHEHRPCYLHGCLERPFETKPRFPSRSPGKLPRWARSWGWRAWDGVGRRGVAWGGMASQALSSLGSSSQGLPVATWWSQSLSRSPFIWSTTKLPAPSPAQGVGWRDGQLISTRSCTAVGQKGKDAEVWGVTTRQPAARMYCLQLLRPHSLPPSAAQLTPNLSGCAVVSDPHPAWYVWFKGRCHQPLLPLGNPTPGLNLARRGMSRQPCPFCLLPSPPYGVHQRRSKRSHDIHTAGSRCLLKQTHPSWNTGGALLGRT